MELSKDILEFIQLLNLEKVEYLVVGGWAYGLHYKPRYTKDIDILIGKTSHNAEKMMRVVNAFGFGSLDISKDDFLKEGYIIQLGFAPNRIDILTDIVAVDFKLAYENRISINYKNIELMVIGIDDLIKNKESAARDQDLVDVKALKKMKDQ